MKAMADYKKQSYVYIFCSGASDELRKALHMCHDFNNFFRKRVCNSSC